MPEVSMPNITAHMPNDTTPNLHMPSMRDIKAPDIHAPNISAHMPHVAAPNIHMPHITAPNVHMPNLSAHMPSMPNMPDIHPMEALRQRLGSLTAPDLRKELHHAHTLLDCHLHNAIPSEVTEKAAAASKKFKTIDIAQLGKTKLHEELASVHNHLACVQNHFAPRNYV